MLHTASTAHVSEKWNCTEIACTWTMAVLSICWHCLAPLVARGWCKMVKLGSHYNFCNLTALGSTLMKHPWGKFVFFLYSSNAWQSHVVQWEGKSPAVDTLTILWQTEPYLPSSAKLNPGDLATEGGGGSVGNTLPLSIFSSTPRWTSLQFYLQIYKWPHEHQGLTFASILLLLVLPSKIL